jgi:WD40 repeat protein
MSNLGIPRGELRGRDTQTGRVLWRVSDANRFSTVDLLRFLPDGTLLTGKGSGGRSLTPQDDSLAGLQARDGLTGQTKPMEIIWGDQVGTREPRSIEILEPSADGKTLVVSSGSGGNGVQFVDLKRKTITGFFGSNTQVGSGPWATSADGKWLAGSYSNGIGLWDIADARTNRGMTPDVQLKIEGQLARLNALKFSASGALATGLANGRVLLWGSNFIASAIPAWETTTGRSITSLSFSADGKTLWSGDERGELKARDAQSGTLQSTLRLRAPQIEGEVPEWVKWDRSGKAVKSTP